MKRGVVAVIGPTAIGKTDLAIEIANKFDGEIVSADSMQIYKYMPIGSAQPNQEQLNQIKHHIIDFVDPKDDYNVALYQKDARTVINDIDSRGKLPVICGGTGLYINSLLYDYKFTPAEIDADYRNNLVEQAKEFGERWLFNELKRVDEISAERIHPNNIKRIIRALEVYHLTGKPFSSFQDKIDTFYYDNTCVIALNTNRSMLYRRIEERVDAMMASGLLEEVHNLIDYGCNQSHKSMQGLGYKELLEYFDGDIGLEAAVDSIKINTRHFAKRQLTWFRRLNNIEWLNIEINDAKDDINTKTFNIVGNYFFN